uniref:BTB domain-containing protein n=1 Tax=Panagrolaimus davidi TaxID=227884 RepID=A0A914QB91_9BILA
MPKNMNISVNATISCESANYVRKCTCLYTKSDEYWLKICSLDDILDPNKNFMSQLKSVTIWVKATLTIFNANDLLTKKIKIDSLGPKLWENENGKDAKIVVDGKEIKVHKSVLQTRSTMLKNLIDFEVKTEPETKKMRGMPTLTPENSSSDLILINNYGFNIVEKAVMFCYDISCFDGFSAKDGINLLKFAEEFQMTDLKEKAEDCCIKNISGSNVCFYVNSSVDVKADKLYHKCFEYLLRCMKDGTAVKDVDKLNAEMKEKLFANAFTKA